MLIRVVVTVNNFIPAAGFSDKPGKAPPLDQAGAQRYKRPGVVTPTEGRLLAAVDLSVLLFHPFSIIFLH
jgi:hypothetical protein